MNALKTLLSEDFKDRHRWTWWRVRRSLVRPPQPRNPDGQILVHLGCGGMQDARFINIDAMPWPHVHHVGGIERLPMFTDASVDFLYASHCLEHVSFLAVPAVLREWWRVLRPGGRVRVSVPDFDKILAMYVGNDRCIEAIEPTLLGGQTYAFNFHKSLYHCARLEALLLAAGFVAVREWQPDGDALAVFDDWSRKCVVVNGQRWPVSLNLEADKP
jgi:predicted SAM-dependent methyltransferase